MHNYDKFGHVSYLTAGDIPLPGMFLYFTVSYALCLYFWTREIGKQKKSRNSERGHSNGIVYQIHHMMTILLSLKMLSLFFDSVRYHFIGVTGHAELWSVVYYTFLFLKGITLFTVILLIGSGWSFVKPFLHAREKKIVFCVLLLQVIDNVAIVVLANETEGEKQYDGWNAVLHLVDILCCCAVLVPIVWQVNSLEKSAGEDQEEVAASQERNVKSVQKLKLFRTFYLLVVSYIYFTRVIVYIFATFLGFRQAWLLNLITELGTLLFYVVTGFTFRPLVEENYVELVSKEGDDSDEPPGGNATRGV